jgi:His-Xaa-Ser system protein HxsD
VEAREYERQIHCCHNREDSLTKGLEPVDAAPQLWDASGHVGMRVDPAIYPLEAALAAGYKFTDRAFVWLQSATDPPHYQVFLRPKTKADSLTALSEAFANELIDQALRCRLERQFAAVRALITAQAFAEGNLLDVAAAADYAADPEHAGSRR